MRPPSSSLLKETLLKFPLRENLIEVSDLLWFKGGGLWQARSSPWSKYKIQTLRIQLGSEFVILDQPNSKTCWRLSTWYLQSQQKCLNNVEKQAPVSDRRRESWISIGAWEIRRLCVILLDQHWGNIISKARFWVAVESRESLAYEKLRPDLCVLSRFCLRQHS